MTFTDWHLLPAAKRHDVSYLSVSSAKTYAQCPRAYYLSKVARVGPMEPSNFFLEYGSVTHAVIEAVNKYRLATAAYPDEAFVAQHVDEKVSASKVFSPSEKSTSRKTIYQIVMRYLADYAPDIHPLLIENDFLMRHGANGLTIYGLVDVTEDDCLWDYKVTGKPVEAAILHSEQLHTYALAWRLITGYWPPKVGIINLCRTTGEIRKLSMPVEESRVMQTLDTLERVWHNVQAQRFGPTPGSQCSKCLFAVEDCPQGLQWLADRQVGTLTR